MAPFIDDVEEKNRLKMEQERKEATEDWWYTLKEGMSLSLIHFLRELSKVDDNEGFLKVLEKSFTERYKKEFFFQLMWTYCPRDVGSSYPIYAAFLTQIPDKVTHEHSRTIYNDLPINPDIKLKCGKEDVKEEMLSNFAQEPQNAELNSHSIIRIDNTEEELFRDLVFVKIDLNNQTLEERNEILKGMLRLEEIYPEIEKIRKE